MGRQCVRKVLGKDKWGGKAVGDDRSQQPFVSPVSFSDDLEEKLQSCETHDYVEELH